MHRTEERRLARARKTASGRPGCTGQQPLVHVSACSLKHMGLQGSSSLWYIGQERCMRRVRCTAMRYVRRVRCGRCGAVRGAHPLGESAERRRRPVEVARDALTEQLVPGGQHGGLLSRLRRLLLLQILFVAVVMHHVEQRRLAALRRQPALDIAEHLRRSTRRQMGR